MNKINFKALALATLMLGFVVAAPVFADDEQNEGQEFLLAGGGCHGAGGCSGGNGNRGGNGGPAPTNTQPQNPQTQQYPQQGQPNQAPQYRNTNTSHSCSGHIFAGCNCKNKSNKNARQKLLG